MGLVKIDEELFLDMLKLTWRLIYDVEGVDGETLQIAHSLDERLMDKVNRMANRDLYGKRIKERQTDGQKKKEEPR